MHNFKELIVWKKARILVTEIYKISDLLPDTEKYGLKSQIQRCVVSIPANIAEGCGRRTDSEMNHFLDISNGSSYELETLLILCVDLEFIKSTDCETAMNLNEEIQRMIRSLKQSFN